MKYKKLGKTGLKVSVLGFGASPLGEEFGKIDVNEAQKAVDLAIDFGINYFDVAPYYGRTLAEERLGRFLQGKRNKIFLATKVCRYDKYLPDGFNFSYIRVIKSVEESLRRLRTDVIDVFQIHDVEFGTYSQILNETLPAMDRLKKDGKIRFIGITGYPLNFLKKIASAFPVDTILSYSHYNLVNTSLGKALAPFCRENGIALINASPLNMRLLTELGAPEWHPAQDKVIKTVKKAVSYCRAHGINISNLAMKFALNYENVATTLVGMNESKHVTENTDIIENEVDPNLLNEVLKILEPVKDINWLEGLPENNDPDSVKKSTF